MDHPPKPPHPVVAILLGVVVNFVLGRIMLDLKAPVYQDAIGTITVTLLCGWRTGAAVGVISTMVGGAGNFHLFYFVFTQISIAAFTGFAARRGGFQSFTRVILTGLAMGFVAAAVSAPAAALAFGHPTDFIGNTAANLRNVLFTDEIWREPLDKIVQCLVAFALFRLYLKKNPKI